MDELIEKVIENLCTHLVGNYTKRGKSRFIQKIKDYNRENYIVFYLRKSKTYPQYIEISSVCGILYKQVNALDKMIIKDFLNNYPIIAGNLTSFNPELENKNFFMVYNIDDIEEAIPQIIKNIQLGAENLFYRIYPSLKDIIYDIKNKNDRYFIREYVYPTLRDSIRVAAMIYLIEGKDNALEWFQHKAPEEKLKELYKKEMEKVWP